MKVRKAVIPAAGFGTRFLPIAKSMPKEMLPVVDTPTIQYVVEEAVAAGLTDILMIIGKSKRAIEEHFYRNFELEDELRQKGKEAMLKEVDHISHLADIHFIWQKELNGLGDAVRYARHHTGSEPFALLLGDTLLAAEDGSPKITSQMIDVYNRFEAPVVALEQVPREKVSRYGIAGGSEVEDGLMKMDQLVEKPDVDEAPSDLAIAGRYVFTAEIFEHLEAVPPGKNGELQLTDAMARMLKTSPIYGLRFAGKRYDIGNKLDFLKTNIEFALRRDDVGPALRAWLKDLPLDG